MLACALLLIKQGFPKAMYISHGYLARAVRNIGLQARAGYEMLHSMTGNNRSVLLLPLSHVSPEISSKQRN